MLGVLQRHRQTNVVFHSVYEIVEMLRQTKKDYYAANVTLLKYYLAHKYIDKMEINWFIDIELIQKSLKSTKYLALYIRVSTVTSVWIFKAF